MGGELTSLGVGAEAEQGTKQEVVAGEVLLRGAHGEAGGGCGRRSEAGVQGAHHGTAPGTRGRGALAQQARARNVAMGGMGSEGWQGGEREGSGAREGGPGAGRAREVHSIAIRGGHTGRRTQLAGPACEAG